MHKHRELVDKWPEAMSTRRYPRTMEEAFGPYARGPVREPRRPFDRADLVVMTASAVVACVLLGLAVWGVL